MYGAQVSKAEFENFALKNFGKELVCLKLFSVRVKCQLGNGLGTECQMVNPAVIRFIGKYLVHYGHFGSSGTMLLKSEIKNEIE